MAFDSAPRDGGLLLTCGNSVMVGVKYDNYMAMLDEAQRLNEAPAEHTLKAG